MNIFSIIVSIVVLSLSCFAIVKNIIAIVRQVKEKKKKGGEN